MSAPTNPLALLAAEAEQHVVTLVNIEVKVAAMQQEFDSCVSMNAGSELAKKIRGLLLKHKNVLEVSSLFLRASCQAFNHRICDSVWMLRKDRAVQREQRRNLKGTRRSTVI